MISQRAMTVFLSRVKVTEADVENFDWYILGDLPPHYPVPAIRTVVVTVPDSADHPAFNTIAIYNLVKCPCCDGNTGLMACLWDFDSNRSFDFNIPCGEYTTAERVEEGVQQWQLRSMDTLGTVQ